MSTGRSRCSREQLVRAAAEATSHTDLLRRLGRPLDSGSLRRVRSRLADLGVDTSHFEDVRTPSPSRHRYSETRLRGAAVRAHSLREVLEELGIPAYDSAYSHLKRRLAGFGIDTSHFTASPHGGHPVPTRQALHTAATGARSLSEVARRLGLPVTTATRRRVKQWCTELGVPADHLLGQGHFRGVPSGRRKPAGEILRRLPTGAPRAKSAMLRRALLEVGAAYHCAECGLGDRWRNRPLVLEVDHVNGDRADNRRENLRFLCPSCHSQSRTFSRRRAARNSWRGPDTTR